MAAYPNLSLCNVNLVDGLVWNEEARGSNPLMETKVNASVVKLVYTPDLKSDAFRKGHAGSKPAVRTRLSQCRLAAMPLRLGRRLRGFESHH